MSNELAQLGRLAIVSAIGLSAVFGMSAHGNPGKAAVPPASSRTVDEVLHPGAAEILRERMAARSISLFNNTMETIQATYYSPDRIEEARAQIEATRAKVAAGQEDPFTGINAILRNLDPHSRFERMDDAATDLADVRGFAAIGFSPTLVNDKLYVSRVFYNGAAVGKGLIDGDVVTKIDGAPIATLNMQKIDETICRTHGTVVSIDLERLKDGKPIHRELKCNTKHAHMVNMRVLNGRVGYAHITQFSEGTADDLRQALQLVESRFPHIDGYVLDLRGDPGGLVSEAHEIIDLFVDSDAPIFMQLNRESRAPTEHQATQGDIINGKPLTVLLDGNSWSASELTAMALQFQKRATVVGAPSAGKGSVQTPTVMRSDGKNPLTGMLVLTTNLYAMPDGSSPQKYGVRPNIYVADPMNDNVPREAALPRAFENPQAQLRVSASATMNACTLTPQTMRGFEGMTTPLGHLDSALVCGMKTVMSKKGPAGPQAAYARDISFNPR